MDIRFKIDGDRYLDFVTWDLQIAMSKGEMTPENQKQLCAAFLVNKNDEFYEISEANKILGALTLRKVQEAAAALNVELTRMLGGASPLATTTEPPS